MLSLFSTGTALACGSWLLEDLEAKRSFRFKINGIELVDPHNRDPEFMQTGKKGAHFISGDRFVVAGDTIQLLKFSRKNSTGGRLYKKIDIATYANDVLKFRSGSEYVISSVTDDPQKILVKQGEKVVAQGSMGACKDPKLGFNAQREKPRVAAYLIWKNLKLDPHGPRVENWWW